MVGLCRLAMIIAGGLALFGSSASAQDLQMGYSPDVEEGAAPDLIVTPERPLRELRVVLQMGADPGSAQTFTYRDIAAGQAVVVTWEGTVSASEARAEIRGVFQDGFVSNYVVPMSWTVGASLEIDMDSIEADIETGRLSVEVSGRVDTAELVAYGAYRKELSRQHISVDSGPGRIHLDWEGDLKKIVVLDVSLRNETSFVAFEYSPWYLEIPHQDVLFETNQSVIPPEEEWKLEESLAELQAVHEMYGEMIEIKLYIGGCTDRVGMANSNRDLSARRARAIGRWFESHGYRTPIYTYGFGETWPAIPTEDGVDEPANRRAIYMVGTRPPAVPPGTPRAQWRPL